MIRLVAISLVSATLAVVPLSWAEEKDAEAAQLTAERVRGAEFNRDKLTSFHGETTKLQAEHIPLVPFIQPVRRLTANVKGGAAKVKGSADQLQSALSDLGARESEREIVIALPGAVLFNFDRSDLRPDAVLVLDKVVKILEAYKTKPATITGHTDAMGTDEYNQRLSDKRAAAVLEYLAASGIARSRLTAKGLGESRPVADNATAEGRQKNRRVEVVLQK